MVYSATESYYSQTLSFASLRNARQIFGLFCHGMVQFPNTIFRLANQYVVYRYICIQYHFYSAATESYFSQTLSFASLRKCMVDFWFILLRNGTIPKTYLSPRESVSSIQVYMYSVFYIICVKSGIKLRS